MFFSFSLQTQPYFPNKNTVSETFSSLPLSHKKIILTFVPDKSKQKSNQNTTRRIDSHFPANNKTFVFIAHKGKNKNQKTRI